MNTSTKSGATYTHHKALNRLCLIVIIPVCFFACSNGNQHANFQISEGYAKNTLKDFAWQAEAEILFDLQIVEGVRTNAVSGSYDPHEALDIMLEDTNLKYDIDVRTGAFAVSLRSSITMNSP